MKVLFLSITAGHGHTQAAYSIMECLKERDIECKLLDTFEYINIALKQTIDKGYLISTKFTPAIYGGFYKMAERRLGNREKFSINQLVNSILGIKLYNFIKDYRPDVIVCTHVFAAEIITQLKKKGLEAKTIGIVTDYTIHPYWEDTDMDYYITANKLLNNEAKKKGIPVDKIKPIGIPINKKFSKNIDKSEARKILGIEDKTTILVMSGSMGYGNVVKAIKDLDKLDLDFQIVSICGKNQNLKQQIDDMVVRKKIYNYGFTDKVDIFMDASECIVTKPGGLTVSECLAKKLPMVLINPIPGQEDRNVEFLLNNGVCIKVTDTFPIVAAVNKILSDNERREAIVTMMSDIRKPNASNDITDLIVNMGCKTVKMR